MSRRRSPGANDDPLHERAGDERIWALLDDQLSPDELRQLEQDLASDPVLRRQYLECVQLETELHDYFRKPAASPPPPTAPDDATATWPFPSLAWPTPGGGPPVAP